MLIKSALLPTLASFSVGGVTSYGCYVHLSSSSLGTSDGNESPSSLELKEKPNVEGENTLQPTVVTNSPSGENAGVSTPKVENGSSDTTTGEQRNDTTGQTPTNEEQASPTTVPAAGSANGPQANTAQGEVTGNPSGTAQTTTGG